MLALAGSEIDATGGNLTLGDATKVNGFYGNGTIEVGPSTVTLADSNDAVLDSASLVTLGAGGSHGTINTANGLTLDFGGNITGYGTLSTPNNIAKPLINNGHITGSNVSQRITLSGYVKGVGTFDNVNFTGTFSPGLSPTTSVVGNIGLLDTSTLIMELGGTASGSGYDQLQSSGTIGFDGILQVTKINGFEPALNNIFNLFDGSLSGLFESVSLPSLAPGLAWNQSQLYTTGVISVVAAAGLAGDFNNDGFVDGADYTVWRNNLGTNFNLNGNGDESAGSAGIVNEADYSWWRQHYGNSNEGGGGLGNRQSNNVPEPATWTILVLAAAGGCFRRARSAWRVPTSRQRVTLVNN